MLVEFVYSVWTAFPSNHWFSLSLVCYYWIHFYLRSETRIQLAIYEFLTPNVRRLNLLTTVFKSYSFVLFGHQSLRNDILLFRSSYYIWCNNNLICLAVLWSRRRHYYFEQLYLIDIIKVKILIFMSLSPPWNFNGPNL